MNLAIFTIVKEGMPYIERHLPIFEQLKSDWTWIVVHGAAANVGSTRWCKPQQPQLSKDGTSEYINRIIRHPRIKVYQRQLWTGGKDEMCNRAIAGLTEPCVLLQVDVDEFWTAEQIDKIVSIFNQRPDVYRMLFWCRYFLGPDIISTSTDGYGNRRGEWLRAFRFEPDMVFQKHEPPVLHNNSRGATMERDETRAMGLVFDHFAWALESQVLAKERFYRYRNAVAQWRKLQANTKWPVADLRSFLNWVGPNASADKVKL